MTPRPTTDERHLHVVPAIDHTDHTSTGSTSETTDGHVDDSSQEFLLVDGQAVSEVEARRVLDGPSPKDLVVLPGWARSRSAVVDAAQAWGLERLRVVAFHGLRLPRYGWRLVRLSPFGVGRAVGLWWAWVRDVSYVEDRATIRETGKGNIAKLRSEHNHLVARRAMISAGASVFGLMSFGVWWATPFLTQLTLVLAMLVGLGWFGRPIADRSIVERVSYERAAVPPFTESLMLDALRQCGAEPTGARSIQVVQVSDCRND